MPVQFFFNLVIQNGGTVVNNRETAYTIGQSGEIGGNIVRALPKALKLLERMEGIPPGNIIRYSQEGERLSCALATMFKMMYNGHADIVALMSRSKS